MYPVTIIRPDIMPSISISSLSIKAGSVGISTFTIHHLSTFASKLCNMNISPRFMSFQSSCNISASLWAISFLFAPSLSISFASSAVIIHSLTDHKHEALNLFFGSRDSTFCLYSSDSIHFASRNSWDIKLFILSVIACFRSSQTKRNIEALFRYFFINSSSNSLISDELKRVHIVKILKY